MNSKSSWTGQQSYAAKQNFLTPADQKSANDTLDDQEQVITHGGAPGNGLFLNKEYSDGEYCGRVFTLGDLLRCAPAPCLQAVSARSGRAFFARSVF
ncbi:hypothetical protein [uncultured Maritimibacter sp.]|jgi:hypothetical protein|uniref:hypothetical protein n=1 Tax=uncultured Maritimibacter sp. TaxID=991866 RepID=UPI0026277669|nr:hypothetical protein [uncultured Maritimibacter sp.]